MAIKGGNRGSYVTGIAAGLVLAGVGTAHAQTSTPPTPQLGSARIVEWDLPVDADFNPGAMVVDTRGEDNNTIWFVTRMGGQKVYRFNLQKSLMQNGGPARWTSWDLLPTANSGGLKKLRPSHDRRFVFVRTGATITADSNSAIIQSIDTQACTATGTLTAPATCASALKSWEFFDQETGLSDVLVSDLAVDDSNRVFTTGTSSAFPDGYLQMLNPAAVTTNSTSITKAPAGTATRWHVAGVNQCASAGLSGFCNSGVDVYPGDQRLVYMSDQGHNAIAELNIASGVIRRWALPPDANAQPVAEPRMLKIDSNGIVWAITGSGHLVSLNPKNSSGCR